MFQTLYWKSKHTFYFQ